MKREQIQIKSKSKKEEGEKKSKNRKKKEKDRKKKKKSGVDCNENKEIVKHIKRNSTTYERSFNDVSFPLIAFTRDILLNLSYHSYLHNSCDKVNDQFCYIVDVKRPAERETRPIPTTKPTGNNALTNHVWSCQPSLVKRISLFARVAFLYVPEREQDTCLPPVSLEPKCLDVVDRAGSSVK